MYKELMMLTKVKNNTHEQRQLPNDEGPDKGSNGHETLFRRISTDAEKMTFVSHVLAYAAFTLWINCYGLTQ